MLVMKNYYVVDHYGIMFSVMMVAVDDVYDSDEYDDIVHDDR